MHKISSLLAIALVALLACERKAEIPVFVTVDNFRIETDFATQGSASSRITTIWVELDQQEIGVFELPASFPLITNGTQQTLKIIPGINLNGVTALRNQYEYYEPFTLTKNFVPGEEIKLQSPGIDFPVTKYDNLSSIIRVEDFEGAGLNFDRTSKSDTTILITNEPSEIFSEPLLDEINVRSGKIVIPRGNSIVEFKSINSYVLPKFSTNVYLEVNFKCEVPVTFGVFANGSGQIVQAPVVTVFPTDEWKKIYINLAVEVSAYPNAANYNVFFGAINTDQNNTKTIFIDNMKLVY
jgi:hypothetical protein